MNKRQYKKHLKKLKCKSYYKMREKRIVMIADKYRKPMQPLDPYCLNIVYIVDSKRMNLKHPHSVKLLGNCYPTSSKEGNNETSFTLEFKAGGISDE